MPSQIDARQFAESLVGTTLQTPAREHPNTVLRVEGANLMVATEDSPEGDLCGAITDPSSLLLARPSKRAGRCLVKIATAGLRWVRTGIEVGTLGVGNGVGQALDISEEQFLKVLLFVQSSGRLLPQPGGASRVLCSA